MRRTNSSLRSILGLIEVQSLRSATDQELLRRFVGSNDEFAFRVIAERHGPMVLSVGRRLLQCPHDAEDAFQATFLVFSKRAASIRKSESLGSWLHGVAKRIAQKIRREQARRRRHERVSLRPAVDSASEQWSWAEVRVRLDEELLRLPEQYRSVVVLCYLEGLTRDEAASRLGLTPSALHGRLERGRKLLASRLRKRGLTLSAVLVPLAFCPGELLATVCTPAVRDASGSIAPKVQQLANELLKGTIMTKTKWATAALVCATTLAVGVGYTAAQPRIGQDKDTVLPHIPIVKSRPKGSDDSDNLKNTLLALDKHMWEAGAKGDWKERQKFLADDLVSISVLGKYGKADAALSDQRLRTVDWTIHDPEVVSVSPDVAMLSYRYDCKITSADGKVLETRKDYRVVYTWAHRNGGWVLVFSYDDHGRLPKESPFVDVSNDVGIPSAYPRSGKELFSGGTLGGSKNAPANSMETDLNLLKTKVELAMLTVKEKQIKLDVAIEKKADRNEIELLKIEVERAKLLVKEAEFNLSAATKKGQAPSSSYAPK
jgi:RNA polymerase sigma factor (sigma-70 family)